MEIDVVGYHLEEDMKGHCEACGQPSTFVVMNVESGIDFELCHNCIDGGYYAIREDRIATGFRRAAGENVVNIFDWAEEHKT